MSDVLTRLLEANSEEKRFEYARRWKADGKKVVGYLCSYVPEEIIYAAGMFPFRVMGTWRPDTLLADAYFPISSCSFCRSCLDAGLKHEYDFLDGLVATTSCRTMMRLFDYWRYFNLAPFNHMLELPWKSNSVGQTRYLAEVSQLREALERTFGLQITDQGLREAMSVYEETRRLLRKLYQLRAKDRPPISGTEALAIVTAAMVMPREEFNPLLAQLLSELEQPDRGYSGNARILVTGSLLSNPAEIALIEGVGGLVVADDLCTGSRYFWDVPDFSKEPVEALASHYLTRIPCMRMFDQEKMFRHVLNLVRDYRVEGIIYSSIKCCDPSEYGYPLFLHRMRQAGIPVLGVEREYALAGEGQFQTRVGAFVEMLSVPD